MERKINVGIIGSGWMGCTHARAYLNVQQVYGCEIIPVLKTIADVNEEAAKAAKAKYGFGNWTTRWEDIVEDPEIQLVVVATPNIYHIEQAISAAEHGKAVFCEKPFGMNVTEVKKGLSAIKKADVTSMIGFVYINNPILQYARQLVQSGELGEVISFNGEFNMDHAVDPEAPHVWRHYSKVSGALGDTATHVFSISDYLIGEDQIDEVCGIASILYEKRRNPKNKEEMLPVENDDQVDVIFKYKNGAHGNITSSRVAPGNKVGERFEIQMTKGTIRFDQERMSELQVYRHNDPVAEQGFKTILQNPQHGEFGYFYPQTGLGVGYMDLMTIQAHKMLKAAAEGEKVKPDAESGYYITVLTDAILKSISEHRWVKVDECR